MAKKIRNPLAQALGLVFQGMRDTMNGISSSQVAHRLGLAGSHYRMIEAGSALLQPSRAIRVIQTFNRIEFVPLCEVLVCIQFLDSAKKTVREMETSVSLLKNTAPSLEKVLTKFNTLWKVIEDGKPGEAAKKIIECGLRDELARFLTTAPVPFSAAEIDDFMSPTYDRPLSGQLYGKIGDILQGVAPFYLEVVLQLIDNLRNITPRVTAEELARWEDLHQNKFSHLIGIVRRPEIVVEPGIFDYSYLWEDGFQKILIIYRDGQADRAKWAQKRISENLRRKFEAERLKYERQLQHFDEVLDKKLKIVSGKDKGREIDGILLYRGVAMNNLWAYIMNNGYVVPFIDNAGVDSTGDRLYGTSLGYDETSEKLFMIRKLFSDIGLAL
ncbi:MAG: hypothetical protein JW749_01690 [Sedimentisphaerales bacterium]|nr:hypothetical protein [Sedimentisphaerales bacterium]